MINMAFNMTETCNGSGNAKHDNKTPGTSGLLPILLLAAVGIAVAQQRIPRGMQRQDNAPQAGEELPDFTLGILHSDEEVTLSEAAGENPTATA